MGMKIDINEGGRSRLCRYCGYTIKPREKSLTMDMRKYNTPEFHVHIGCVYDLMEDLDGNAHHR
jgi:hypothetical protein